MERERADGARIPGRKGRRLGLAKQTRRIIAAVLALAIAAASAPAERPAERGAKEGSLAGRLLVALPEMTDPRFQETVIYLVDHNESGAFGLVVNRPLGEIPLADLMARLGVEPKGAEGTLGIFYGGPVEPGRGFVLHSADYESASTRYLGGGFALSLGLSVLRDIAAGEGPARSLVIFGYAGWGPGQLESEIARGGWVTVEGDPALVFDADNETKWRRALARYGVDL